MKTIGLTGGIGAGKSYVAKVFQALGVPVYNSDERAKAMYFNSTVKEAVVNLLGNEAYADEELNKAYISEKVFSDKSLLQQLNQIIHPAVAEDFRNWQLELTEPYCIKEAAILFESGAYKSCHEVINVVATPALRVSRVLQRSGLSKEEIELRMKKQWTEKDRVKNAHHLVFNNAGDKLLQQVLKIHESILSSATQ